MRPWKTVLFGAALIMSASASISPTEAMSVSPTKVVAEHQSMTTNVAWRRACRYRRCGKVWVNRRLVVVPRVVIRPRVYVGPRAAIRRGYHAHVNWCLARYRSYNPATNTFTGYDGLRHDCVSPY